MKKIISLLVVCFMLCSMSIMASAATFTISSTDLTTEDYNEADGYYEIPVYIDDLWIENTDLTNQTAKAGNGWKLEVSFPADKLAVHNWIANDGTVQYASYNASRDKWTKSDIAVSSQEFSQASGLLNIAGGTTAGGIMPNSLNDGDFCYVLLTPIDGATGVADVNIKLIVSDTTAIEYTATTTSKIDLGGEVVDETPETSTVRTFPKLRWDETNKQLTTVGVITIGKDYDTVKYGINIEKGEGTVNYWANSAVKTTDEKEAYYAVRLDDIDDETTDIKSTSAAKAILSNGAEGDAETKDSVIE